MTLIGLMLLLTGHFVADFMLQSDRMAVNKSKSWSVLTQHVSVYTAAMLVVSLFVLEHGMPVVWFGVVTFVTHFLTDALTSRLTSRLWFFTQRAGLWDRRGGLYNDVILVDPWVPDQTGKRHWFFVAIGFDQLIHAWTLALTYLWVS